MKKKTLVAALAVLTLVTLNARKAGAQECQNLVSFGVHAPERVDKSLKSHLEVTYFTTDDPNAFLNETAGVNRSASYKYLDTVQFVAKLQGLEQQGVARIRKHQSSNPYLGELAQLNLEHSPSWGEARMVNAAYDPSDANDVFGMDRKTEFSVNRNSTPGSQYYRVALLSWFVNQTSTGAQQVVDYDANVLLKPGETAIFKLMSDNEIKRSGTARNYIALTMK